VTSPPPGHESLTGSGPATRRAVIAGRPEALAAGIAVDTVRAAGAVLTASQAACASGTASAAPATAPALSQKASVNEAAMSSRPRVNAGEVLGHAVE
jgi:hypothetical protein